MQRIEIIDYDPRWRETFAEHAAIIAEALDDESLRIEHVGSTSVPGLGAKPIVDILLVVRDSADESAYLQKLEAAGYALTVREPEFHEHRMFRTAERNIHLHVYSEGSPEAGRLLRFRDELRESADARRYYEETKRRLAASPWPDMDAYARAKSGVIEKILVAASQRKH